MTEDRDQTVEEQPSTYNRKAQNVGFLMLGGLLVVLSIGTLMRFFSGTDVNLNQPVTTGPVDTRQSPDQEGAAFLDRIKRAEKSNEEIDLSPREDLMSGLRDKRDELNDNFTTNTQGVVGDVVEIDPWQAKELERVRGSRYDDYDLDLGFNKASTSGSSDFKAAKPNSFTPGKKESVSDAIANVRKEIARAKAYKAQVEQGGASSLQVAGSSSSAPQLPLEVGHTKSKSINNLPQPNQKLLPVSTVIRAVLDQKIVSDYVGPFRARVIEDVYDVSNRFILIPKGSAIDGRSLRISNINEPIQARMALTVNWVVLPNGHKLNFSRQYALDQEGVSAIKDEVNRHFLAQFLGVAAYALLSSESSRSGSGLNNDDTYAGEVGESARQQFAPLAQKYLRLVPTITLRAGTPLRVYISEELYVSPWSTVGESYASKK